MSTYEGPRALGFSRYASPTARKAQLADASAVPTTIATKEQLAIMEHSIEATPPAAELAVEQGAALKKEVDQHTTKVSRAVSSAVENTRQLLNLLREATPNAEVVDHLWQELEQLFESTNEANTALPEFMEKQRDNMSLYHSSMMHETIRETQQELTLQHKKVNTQHNLILEQQDAFQNYKTQTAPKLESLQERVSRLTLEKGNLRTEVCAINPIELSTSMLTYHRSISMKSYWSKSSLGRLRISRPSTLCRGSSRHSWLRTSSCMQRTRLFARLPPTCSNS
jgi:hypothetical protein